MKLVEMPASIRRFRGEMQNGSLERLHARLTAQFCIIKYQVIPLADVEHHCPQGREPLQPLPRLAAVPDADSN